MREHSFGFWEGLTEDEIESEYPGMLGKRYSNWWEYIVPGGESYELLSKRVEKVLKRYYNKKVIFVCHEMVSKVLRGNYSKMNCEDVLKLKHKQNVVFKLEDGEVLKLIKEETLKLKGPSILVLLMDDSNVQQYRWLSFRGITSVQYVPPRDNYSFTQESSDTEETDYESSFESGSETDEDMVVLSISELEKLKWIIITSDNADEVMAKLEEQGIDPVLFGLTDKDFQLIAKNFAQIRAHMKKLDDIVSEYKNYYEAEETSPTK